MKIGFIGTGIMGTHIINNMLNNNYEVICYTRTKSKAEEVIQNGAKYADTLVDVVRYSDIIFTMVGYPSDIEDIFLGENGFLKVNLDGKIFIDLTTSTPTLAKEIYKKYKSLNARVIDAPVSGGSIGAKNATMTIMCGGDEEIFEKVLPIFNVIGKTAVLQGQAGNGQHTKMCNQIALAANMAGVMEFITYATKIGMDPEVILKSISFGSAGSSAMSIFTPLIANDNLDPGFYIKHFTKDLRIAIDEMEKLGCELPVTKLVKELYEKLESDGFGELGTQALIKYYLSEY